MDGQDLRRTRTSAAARLGAVSEADESVDAPNLLTIAARHLGLLANAAIIGALLAVLAALILPSRYQAEAQIYVDPRDLNLIDGQMLEQTDAESIGRGLVESQVEMLTSTLVLEETVDRMRLDQDPDFNGEGQSILGWLLSGIGAFAVGADGEQTQDARALAVAELRSRLTVQRIGNSFVIELFADAESRSQAEQMLSTLLDAFLNDMASSRVQVAERASADIDATVEALRDRATALETEIADFKAEAGITGAEEAEVLTRLLGEISAQLVQARVQAARLTSRRDAARSMGVASTPEAIASLTLRELYVSQATIRADKAEAATLSSPNHPAYLALEAQESSIDQMIQAEYDRLMSSLEQEANRAERDVAAMEAELAALRARAIQVERVQISLRQMQSSLLATRDIYAATLARADQARAQAQIDTSNVRVISSPRTAERRISPPPTPFLMVLGAVAAAALVFMLLVLTELRSRQLI